MNKILLFFSVTIIGCSKPANTIKPIKSDVTEAVYASGIVKSQNQYQAFNTVTGIIKEIYVTEGDIVVANQPLMLIENEASKIMRENALLNYQNSSFNANKAKLQELKISIDFAYQKLKTDSLTFIRQKSLYEQQIGSKTEYEQKQLNYINALTNYESAMLKLNDFNTQLKLSNMQSKNNLKLMGKQENDYILKSIINGKIYAILRKKGELVTAQMPLAIIGAANNFYVELQIDEYDITSIKAGQQVFFTLDSYTNKVFEGVISKINPIMNEKTKSFTVEAVFKKSPNLLYPNLTAEANIVIYQKKNILTLPRKYVNDNNEIIKANGKKIKVKTGLKDLEKIEIIEGLNENEEVILPE